MAETIRVLVPFSRPHLIPVLYKLWNAQYCTVFYPISHDPNHALPVTERVKPFYCGPVPNGWNAMYWKLNFFLDQMPIHAEDRYGFLCDDDAFHSGLYETIQAWPNDVIICSMKRGKRCPPGGNGHPPTALVAQRENIKIGSVGMEQIFVRGKILKNYRFKNFPEADGDLICRIVNDHETKYLPHTYIKFNYWEPGRWD